MLRNARIITRLQWTLRVVALVACVLAPFAAGASAAEEAKPANAGITTGQVTEITDEFVLIRPTDDTPHRHWFRSSASATTIEVAPVSPSTPPVRTIPGSCHGHEIEPSQKIYSDPNTHEKDQ